MATIQHKHAGLILAAGASSRMGQPKALLAMPGGIPLAADQTQRLLDAGAFQVIVVIGANAPAIHPALANCPAEIVVNEAWPSGRLSSLQAGLRAVHPAACGVVILPVDTVGVTAATMSALMHFAGASGAAAVRPAFEDQPGRIVWLSKSLFPELLAIPTDPEFRLDQWLHRHEQALAVNDSAILHNINTPGEWANLRSL